MSDQPGIADVDENVQQEQEEEPESETLTPTAVRQAPNPVPRTTTAWQEYYDSMGVARQKVIQRLADQREYNVTLEPLYDEVDKTKLIKPDEKKTFVRRKISTKDFFEIEKMRESMRTLRTPNRQEVTMALIELYKSLAFIYLADKATGKSITEENFMRCSWPVIKAILDACNLGSVAGQVPLDEQI